MCLLTSGAIKSCGLSAAGVSSITLFNKSEVVDSGYTVTADGAISGILLVEDAAGQTFDFLEDTASAIDKSVQQFYIEQTVKFSLGAAIRTAAATGAITDAEAQKAVNMYMQLVQGRFVAIVKFRSGKSYLFGKENGLSVPELTKSSGESKTDTTAGGVITLTGSENFLAPVVLSSVTITNES